MIRTCKRVNIPTRKIMAILAFLRGRGLASLPYTSKQISNMGTKMRKEYGLNDMMQVVSFFEHKKIRRPLILLLIQDRPSEECHAHILGRWKAERTMIYMEMC